MPLILGNCPHSTTSMRGASGAKVAGTGGFGDTWEKVGSRGPGAGAPGISGNIRKATLEELRKGQLQDFTGQPSKSRMRRLETTSEKKHTHNHLTLESGEREVLGGVKYEHPHCP